MQTLAELVECFQLYAVCEDCERMVEINIPQLIEKEGGEAKVDRIRLRLFCSQCNQRSQALRIVYVGPGRRSASFRYNR